MKILFFSYAFHPGVGGIESVSAILADEFISAGHELELITETPATNELQRSYPVTRLPAVKRIRQLLRWSDVFFQNNISLRSLLLARAMRKPTLLVHQTWIRSARGRIGWNNRIKRMLLGQVTNVAISKAIADDLPGRCTIIPNPYKDDLFRVLPDAVRDQSLVFLGRLVSDKGVDLLLHALAHLADENVPLHLTVIGTGPDEAHLRNLAKRLGLEDRVTFAGTKSGDELVQLLNQHHVIAIPSRWPEPFGIVALEGIACGCVAVGSEDGGLKEAIGPCGSLFPNGDGKALARVIKTLIRDGEIERGFRKAAPQHLARFQARRIASEYLKLIEQLAP